MFNSKPVETVPTPQTDAVVPPELVALSVLQLDLDAPGEGWAAFLAARGVSITIDDIGRASIRRSDARLLFTERREVEAKAREHAAAVERQAIEQDQRFRASLGVGIDASLIPAGMTYGEAVASVELDGAASGFQPRRTTLTEDLFDGGGMVFHPIRPTEE